MMDNDELTLVPGTLVRIEHAGQTVLAVIRNQDRSLFKVLTQAGAELKLKANKILLVFPRSISPLPPANHTNAYLEELLNVSETIRQGIDLEMLSDLVRSESLEAMTIEDLAGLWSGKLDAASYLAMAVALDGDRLFFKSRASGYTPRSPAEVDAERTRLAGTQKKFENRERFFDAVLASLEQSPSVPPDGLFDTEASRHLDILIDFVTTGDLFERKTEALELLAELNQHLSGRTYAATVRGVFDLLVDLKRVQPHENLSLRRHHIRTDFDGTLLDLAEQLAGTPDPTSEGAADLTDLEAFTIDSPSTRDLDDALHVAAHPDGSWDLGIHIADLSALVDPASPLDNEAARRGSSIYLPTGIIPMFPPSLSEGRFSLVAGALRATTSFLLHLDGEGRILGSRVVPGAVRVAHRLSYEEVDAILTQEEHHLFSQMNHLWTLAQKHRQHRLDLGAISIDLPEIKVSLDGDDILVERIEPSPSRLLVAEMMVLAGWLTAELCAKERIPAVYRTQEAPAEADMSYVRDIESPVARQMEMARLMKKGELRSVPAPHGGLGLELYTQATSPIRRYGDLVMNYQLQSHLKRGRPVFSSTDIVTLAARADTAAQECQAVQRETHRYWLIEHLRRQGAVPLEATVLHFDPRSARAPVPVLLKDTQLRAQVHGSGLGVGQEIRVRVVQADPRRDLLKVERV